MKTLIAFYSHSGQTKRIAKIIAEKLGADIYEIVPAREYNADMWKAWDEAKIERQENNYPELKGELADISAYDIILLGTGIWGHTMANPVTSFIRQMDFTGKKMSAFWTFYDHDEAVESDMRNCLKGAEYVKGLPLPRSLTSSKQRTDDVIDEWIHTL